MTVAYKINEVVEFFKRNGFNVHENWKGSDETYFDVFAEMQGVHIEFNHWDDGHCSMVMTSSFYLTDKYDQIRITSQATPSDKIDVKKMYDSITSQLTESFNFITSLEIK